MRIVAFTLLLLTTYQILIWSGWVPTASGMDAAEVNKILAEGWKYHTTPGETIVVGSSRVKNMDQDALGTDLPRLFFLGSNGIEALTLLAQLQKPPHNIAVEINPAVCESDHALCQLADKRIYRIADSLSVIRHEYRPVGVLLSLVNPWIERDKREPTADERKILMRLSMVSLCNNPDPTVRKLRYESLEKLKHLVQQLQMRGCRIVFFRQPSEDSVESGCYMRSLTEDSHNIFPPDQFEWLPQPAGNWHTRDTLHLCAADERRYSAWLGAQLHAKFNQQLARSSNKTL